MCDTSVQNYTSASEGGVESDAGVEPYAHSSSSSVMSMQSGDSEFLDLLGSSYRRICRLEYKVRPFQANKCCFKGGKCASAVAKSLDALVEDICGQNCRLGEMSIDKSALSMKLRDIVLQRTLLDLKSTQIERLLQRDTQAKRSDKNTCIIGGCSTRRIGNIRKKPCKGNIEGVACPPELDYFEAIGYVAAKGT